MYGNNGWYYGDPANPNANLGLNFYVGSAEGGSKANRFRNVSGKIVGFKQQLRHALPRIHA